MERVIITTLCYHGTDCRVAAWQSNGKISRICLEDPREERLLGSIHVGKVQKILPDIKGAFVEIENRTSCYFPYTKESNFLYTMPKKASELRAGDELLVQVTREAIKTKAPCVSSNLNFTGKYLVLTTGNRTLGISAKIPSGKREKLKEFLEELMPEDCSYGIILRTNGALASAEELKEELRSLETQFTQLYQKALHTPCYTKLSKGESITASILKDVHWKETEKIITDQKTLYEELCVSRQDIPVASMCAIEYYEDSLLPLARLYNLERELDQALQEKIWLKSGGFLIIQQTEAFVAIDVNTGKHSSKKDAEENYKQINREAALEIARQLRLRNLSGMILVDFINMKNTNDQSELLQYMGSLVRFGPDADCSCGCNCSRHHGDHPEKVCQNPCRTAAPAEEGRINYARENFKTVARSRIFSVNYDCVFCNLCTAAVSFRTVWCGRYGNYFIDSGTAICKSDGVFPALSVSGAFSGRTANVRNYSDVDFVLYPCNGRITDPVSLISRRNGDNQRGTE